MFRILISIGAVAIAVLAAILVGCGNEREDPSSLELGMGTLVIDPSPDSINAPWQLAGPDNYLAAGSGDLSLDELAVGNYTLEWGIVPGYERPNPYVISQSLAAGETGIFRGDYVETSGSVVIDPSPDSIDAPWTLRGPNGYSDSGIGGISLLTMLIGDYSIEWGEVEGWISPADEMQTLVAGGLVTFSGVYTTLGGFVLIDAGEFTMGSRDGEIGAYSNEYPDHRVALTHSFYLQNTEVTNQQFLELAQWAIALGYATATASSLQDALDGSVLELVRLDDDACEIGFDIGTGQFHLRDVGHGLNPTHPMKAVTWHAAAAYCDWLSLQAELPRAYDHATWQCNSNSPYTAEGYRLPTEAEWEFSCRSGTDTPFNTGDCLDAGTEANYSGYSPFFGCPAGPFEGWTVAIGSYPSNAWGLFEMHGNLWEYCNDWYLEDYYSLSPNENPPGPLNGTERVLRGGSRNHWARLCRSAYRAYTAPTGAGGNTGFRPARSAD